MRGSLARRIIVIVSLLMGCSSFGTAYADPISIAIAAALATVGITVSAAAITTAIVTAVVGAIISFGISMLVGVLSKPKKPKAGSFGSFSDFAGQRVNLSRGTTDTHKIIYGQVRTSGTILFLHTTDGPGPGGGGIRNIFLHMIVSIAGHEVEEIGTVYLEETALTLDEDGFATNTEFYNPNNAGGGSDGNGKLVFVAKHLGGENQEADETLKAYAPDLWTGEHRLRGIAYIYIRFEFAQDNFPNGVPNVSALVKGKRIYDPRTMATVWSDNPALCIRDYLKLDIGLNCVDSELDDATFIASANICDESVTLADETTQKRYTCNGVVDTGQAPIEILKDLATSLAGAIPYVQGQFRCFAGAYSAPVATIDASWLVGSIEIQARTPRDKLFNAVKGVFVDPDGGWLPTDFPAVPNTLYQTQDGGYRIYRDLELPFTTNRVAAQRIAKIALEKSRQGIVVKAPCNFRALELSVWDTVRFTLGQTGWDEKVFRITQWGLNTDGNFNLVLQEESAESYEWNAGEETTYDQAPDTNLPTPGTVSPPGKPVVTEVKYSTTEGTGVKTKALLNWSRSPDAFVNTYGVLYKLATEIEYTPAAVIRETRFELADLAPGKYDFAVVAINIYGSSSTAAVTRREIFGLTDAPSDVSDFSITRLGAQAHLQWGQATDLDVKIGGSVKIKHANQTSGATWENATDIAPQLSGIATNAVVPLATGTYFAKFYDSTGNESETAAEISIEAPTLEALSLISAVDQHTAFDGTKTDMVVTSSTLRLGAGTTFDDGTGNFDSAAGNFDSYGTLDLVLAGSYEFDFGGNDYLDLGAVISNRLEFVMDAIVVDEGTTFDSVSGNFDAREGLFDGSDRARVDVSYFIKTTDDDPSGSPTWGAWQLVNKIGEFACRAYKMKLEAGSQVETNNIYISELTSNIYAPTRDENFEDEAISAGGTTLNYATPFFGKPKFFMTIQGTSSGDTPSYTHVTSGGLYTGVTVQILNGGSGAARTIDLTARSY